MTKRLILILALLFVVGLFASAYAEVQNVKVSGDILMEGVARNKLILRKGNSPPRFASAPLSYVEYSDNISTFLSHVRVRVDADLTDNVTTTIRLLNERTWNTETVDSTNVNVDLAYATMKEFLYSPLSLTIGRQELHYGNDLLIGDIDTNNFSAGHGTAAGTAGTILPRSLDDLSLRKSFDAIKAVLNYDPLVVDAVFARISKTVDSNDPVDLWGLNANYSANKNLTTEAYWWMKRRAKAGAGTTIVTTNPESYVQPSHTDTTQTIGARANYTGIKDLTVGLEGAYQFGRKVNNTALYPDDRSTDGGYRTRRAFAIQYVSKYDLTSLANRLSKKAGELAPSMAFNYTYLSGEAYKNNKKKWHGWDAMYENQAQGTLFNKILGYSNAQLFNVNASVKLMSDLKFSLDYWYLRLNKAFHSAGVGNSPTAVNLTGLAGDPTYNMVPGEKSLGSEWDANLTYDYTEDVQLGINAGMFIPGDAFDKDDNRKTAGQVIGSMKVTF